MYSRRRFILALLLLQVLATARALSVTDDSQREVGLDGPAERIISLAPHVTELLFSAGAGGNIVGVVEHSDYPPQARRIPRVGKASSLDMERLLELRPDLIILWRSGTPQTLIELVGRSGIPVYHSEPRTLEDIADTLTAFGRLAGTAATARDSRKRYLDRLTGLHSRYGGREPVRVFFQFWHDPIFTVGGQHLITRVIDLCGGVNIYAGLEGLTPRVSLEDILVRDPAVILASGGDESDPPWLADWQDWPQLDAVADGHVYTVPADLLLRHTTRILDAAQMMCEFIDRAREGS